MQKVSSRRIRRITLIVLFVFVLLIRFIPYGGEFYATYLYPSISSFLSWVASCVSFSLEEWLVLLFAFVLVFYPIIAFLCGRNWKRTLKGELEVAGWLFVWFYMGWGCNYFRNSFYERLMVAPLPYSETLFDHYLSDYTDSLNASYVAVSKIDEVKVREEIKELYRCVPYGYGLTEPKDYQEPKELCFNELYSSVGVLGYMGPFFCESQVNEELLPVQYPFTYAHELAHLLGVSSEAEANFWAYTVCTHSHIRAVKYAGYLGMLPYIMQNLSKTHSKEFFNEWQERVNPSILQERKQISKYWQDRHSSFLGGVQNVFYDLFLKSNKISNGKQNYADAIAMIIAVRVSMDESPLKLQGRGLSKKQ
ncbi:MAG: DUF3810 domain-containing protein [Bacteroidaceae bacterium]|nr:DUF3810 domain-containing protein [Candidatus Minthousia equi]MCQ2246009.1 DUF3810 domain-containing protein [Bacteroidaceae bacterium]MDO4956265.1 DUF3810 domain-containing protein [Bacteroidales bacterium]